MRELNDGVLSHLIRRGAAAAPSLSGKELDFLSDDLCEATLCCNTAGAAEEVWGKILFFS